MNKEDYLEFLEENQKLREERLEGQEFIEKPKGWLVDKEYTNPENGNGFKINSINSMPMNFYWSIHLRRSRKFLNTIQRQRE